MSLPPPTTFWNDKAESYGGPDDLAARARGQSAIDAAIALGLQPQGKHILEIGCGTGVQAVLFAAVAGSVLALDASVAMIARLDAYLAAAPRPNVTTCVLDWAAVDPDTAGWRKRYDIAWASMTPAVRTVADVQRMEACATGHCVHVGWLGPRENQLMAECYALFGRDLPVPDGTEAIAAILRDLGRGYDLRPLRRRWSWTGTLDQAVADLAGHIELDGSAIDRARLRHHLHARFGDQPVTHHTAAIVGVLLWRPEHHA